ncbi:MAG TPA: cell filamentation protein Fic [Mariniphaga anaerophila]|uniref:Cell filamentation protein Fic n=1 Tax=Mariniphaga anaerophila TaxID=1484053 RepID=A0A831PJA2_9BACT|nr:cell filamentation protein Fic [Mariniphaga anaerophila]
MENHFSQIITIFHDRPLPEKGILAGYAFLLQFIEQQTGKLLPLPRQLAIVTEKHQRYNTANWQVFTKRHKPKNDALSHVIFALKYEGIDLLILKTTFQLLGKNTIEESVLETPTGQYSRKIWFLYEWLSNIKLNIPDLKTGTYVEVLNPELQYPGPATNSGRHRVRNNLPGTPEFCPLIRKTEKLEKFINSRLDEAIHKGLSNHDKDIVRRTAAFLLLKDSKASFAIEGEIPPNLRARNWGKAIGWAGKKALTLAEIERLQQIVIGSKKLKRMGFRKEEGFIGEHDRETFAPLPDHISAKAEDLDSLMNGWLKTSNLLLNSKYDPVLTAATIAFGFVFIHPLSDGNGRIHRYLFHHVLTWMGFVKREMIFPVSAAILNRISDYQEVLEDFSLQRIDLIEWEPTSDHNIRILNETSDLYRYFDLSTQAEFLYECVEETITKIIPAEIDYLGKYDRLTNAINAFINLPNSKVDLLIKYLDQNNGRLSKRKSQKFFDELSEDEILFVEEQYAEIFKR